MCLVQRLFAVGVMCVDWIRGWKLYETKSLHIVNPRDTRETLHYRLLVDWHCIVIYS
jgi:hypothetical protein